MIRPGVIGIEIKQAFRSLVLVAPLVPVGSVARTSKGEDESKKKVFFSDGIPEVDYSIAPLA